MKCYISCPISIPQWQLDLVQKRLRDADNAAVFWKRGTTYGEREKDWIKYCDAFVIVLPNFDWQTSFSNLPKGCKAELDSALKLRKDIYIAYRGVMNNTLAIYKADFTIPGHIRGIPQTYNVLGQSSLLATSFIESVEEPDSLDKIMTSGLIHDVLENKVVQFNFGLQKYDRRLLLLM